MLPRDRAVEDSVMKFFPDYSIINYVSHLACLKPQYKYMLGKQEQAKWNDKLTSRIPAALFVGALLPIIFHKRIPRIQRFKSIKARVLLGLFYMIFPLTAGYFISASSEAEIARQYQLNIDEFKRYRCTNNICLINTKIKFYEDM